MSCEDMSNYQCSVRNGHEGNSPRLDYDMADFGLFLKGSMAVMDGVLGLSG